MSNDIALPKAFEESTKPLFGEARYAQFCEALRQAPQTTIRLNPFKITGCELAADKNFAPIAWCGEGRVLPHRPDFTFDPCSMRVSIMCKSRRRCLSIMW